MDQFTTDKEITHNTLRYPVYRVQWILNWFNSWKHRKLQGFNESFCVTQSHSRLNKVHPPPLPLSDPCIKVTFLKRAITSMQVKQWTCCPSTKENFNYSPCWVTLPPTCIFSTVANFIFKRISILGCLNFQWNLCLSLIIYNFPWLSKYLKNVTLKLKKFTWTTSLQTETTKL